MLALHSLGVDVDMNGGGPIVVYPTEWNWWTP